MNRYFLRVEAINLNNFVYDTTDLSTTRGGGLLLLNVVESLPRELSAVRLTPLMVGSSTGLYEFKAEIGQEETILGAIHNYLTTDRQLKHATFAVDVQPAHGNDQFNLDFEMLVAKNRWRQMRSPSTAIAVRNASTMLEVCAIDGVRTGDATIAGPEGKSLNVSASVAERTEYGRDQKKQDFYREQSGIATNARFTRDLDDLTKDLSQGNLHHKMAVIYLDGNRFGSIKKGGNGEFKRQTDFDAEFQAHRMGLLQELLRRVGEDQSWKTREADYRLETLLWGGDEIIWVVPAWKGWQMLQFFFDQIERWMFRGEKLTFAGGAVFCHHNAPIQRVINVAKNLAEEAKEVSRNQGLFAYEILESFDHIGRRLDVYREERCPQSAGPNQKPDTKSLILSGDGMEAATNAMSIIKKVMPRRKLVQIVHGLLTNPSEISEDERENLKSLIDEIDKEIVGAAGKESHDSLVSYFTGAGTDNRAWWVHVNALWDYIV